MWLQRKLHAIWCNASSDVVLVFLFCRFSLHMSRFARHFPSLLVCPCLFKPVFFSYSTSVSLFCFQTSVQCLLCSLHFFGVNFIFLSRGFVSPWQHQVSETSTGLACHSYHTVGLTDCWKTKYQRHEMRYHHFHSTHVSFSSKRGACMTHNAT